MIALRLNVPIYYSRDFGLKGLLIQSYRYDKSKCILSGYMGRSGAPVSCKGTFDLSGVCWRVSGTGLDPKPPNTEILNSKAEAQNGPKTLYNMVFRPKSLKI